MLINSVNLPVCVRLRTERIHSTKYVSANITHSLTHFK